MDNVVSFFRSGWRPFAGWVCVSGLFVQIVFVPLVVGLCSLFGHIKWCFQHLICPRY